STTKSSPSSPVRPAWDAAHRSAHTARSSGSSTFAMRSHSAKGRNAVMKLMRPICAAVLVLAVGACSGSPSTGKQAVAPRLPAQSESGGSEGRLNLVIWAGYAENGSTDKTVDWVNPFQKKTGCQVNAKVADTSDSMVALMETGRYDGVSASGDATLRLI